MTSLEQEIAKARGPFSSGFVGRQAFPMAHAPRDGRLLRLLVDYSGGDSDHALEDEIECWTIGFNSFDVSGEDRWKFAGWCWSHDHFTEGRGRVEGWLPYDASLVSMVNATEEAEGLPEYNRARSFIAENNQGRPVIQGDSGSSFVSMDTAVASVIAAGRLAQALRTELRNLAALARDYLPDAEGTELLNAIVAAEAALGEAQ